MPRSSFPRAIVHFDGDSFFASVEQVMDHRLRGKPVVTGAERGAPTSVSYEAKRLGCRRGMSMQEIKRLCPDVQIVPGDYTAYSIFARRMYQIARSVTPEVEEYSIDECFADITGLDAKYQCSYEEIALMIKSRLESDLGLTFGVGLGPNKAIAKIGSKYRKPAGFTSIPIEEIPKYLADLPIGGIWGVGMKTSLYFEKLGVHTALDFAQKDENWLREKNISKPYRVIWAELNGAFVRTLNMDEDDMMGSIMVSRTFRPTKDRNILLSQLSKNIERATAKARRHGVSARGVRFYVKTQEFRYYGLNLTFNASLTDPREILKVVAQHLDEVYEPGILYRATGVTLYSLTADHAVIPDLFGDYARIETKAPIIEVVDRVNQKYGRHTLYLGESMVALNAEGRAISSRKGKQKVGLGIEQKKKTLNIPYLGIVR